MTEQELLEMLTSEREAITKAVRAKAIDAMAQSLQWSLPDGVRKAVAEFFQAEIIPEVKAALMEQKGPIVAAAIKASAEIGDKVAELLTKTAVERMTGYYGAEVIKTLFGVR